MPKGHNFAAMNSPALTPEQALQKLRHYCAYQERCHSEVRNKLFELGVWSQYHDSITASLVEDNYLNEERFAIQFAGGHFRIKQWGRTKIKYALKQKQVSDYCIRKAMKEIDEDDYTKTLEKLAETKLKLLRSEKNIFTKKRKLQDFLMRKGFENEYISPLVGRLTNK
jgi:regulatory protein